MGNYRVRFYIRKDSTREQRIDLWKKIQKINPNLTTELKDYLIDYIEVDFKDAMQYLAFCITDDRIFEVVRKADFV